MAIYNLDGTDKEISVLGRYASVKNNGSGVVYASSAPELDDLEASEIVPVQPGESVVVRDCKKKLYVRGSGEIAVVSGNQPFNFFKSAPVGGGGGGAGNGITTEQLNAALLPYATSASVDKKLEEYVPASGGSFNGDVRAGNSSKFIVSPKSNAEDDTKPQAYTGQIGLDKFGSSLVLQMNRNGTPDASAEGGMTPESGAYTQINYSSVYAGYNGERSSENWLYGVDGQGAYPFQTDKDLGLSNRKWRNGYFSENVEAATFNNVDLSTLAKKSEIPTSLPADGGNADTLEGKHASDFEPVVKWNSTSVLHNAAANAGSYTFLTGDFNTGDQLEVRFAMPTAHGPSNYFWTPSPTVYLTIPAVGATTNCFAFTDGTIPDVYMYSDGAEIKATCVLFTRTKENKLRFDGEKYVSQQGIVTEPAWIKTHGMARDTIYWRVLPK